MAKGVNIRIKGVEETLRRIKDTTNQIKKEIDFAMGVNVESMATNAKQLAPVDTGRLRNSISVKKENTFDYSLIAQTNYAAYVEFGTGNLFIQLPEQYWNDLAEQFKARPRKRLVNLKPRPFLRPSVNRFYPILIEDIKEILNKNRTL